MEHIIHQIGKEFLEAIIKKVMSEQIENLDKLTSELFKDCENAAKAMVEAFVAYMNQRMREDKKARKADGLQTKEKDRARTLYTELGNIQIKRDYYYDSKAGCYRYPLDQMLGIESYERVGKSVSAKLVNLAADVSYAKAVEIVSGGELSRQTVHDQILKVNVPEAEVTEQKVVRELHLHADEDHVHMQRPNKKRGKQGQIVPLITVTEGSVPVGKRRNKTVGTKHFVDEKFRSGHLWGTVEGYIEKAYDIEQLKKIYIHGDGGRWIRSGLENFAQTEYVMDGYHYAKAVKKISKAHPTRNVKVFLESAIQKDEQGRVEDFLRELIDVSNEKERENVLEFRTYLFGNWEAIRALITRDIPGSCTEAQISHVLSDRFSRRPIGWSKAGLGKLSAVRVSIANGRSIRPEDFSHKTQKEETYYDYAKRYVKEYVKGPHDWSIFEESSIPVHQSSGTQRMLSAYGRNYGPVR